MQLDQIHGRGLVVKELNPKEKRDRALSREGTRALLRVGECRRPNVCVPHSVPIDT